MILKVPIYVEIDRISPDSAEGFLRVLGEEFYKTIRKNDFKKTLIQLHKINPKAGFPEDLKIINREKALETLRTWK
jgi:hypothetical protein